MAALAFTIRSASAAHTRPVNAEPGQKQSREATQTNCGSLELERADVVGERQKDHVQARRLRLHACEAEDTTRGTDQQAAVAREHELVE